MPDEKFRPIKVKESLVEVQIKLGVKKVIWTNFDYLIGRNFVERHFRRAKLFVRRNFRNFSKNSSLSPDIVSPDKVSD